VCPDTREASQILLKPQISEKAGMISQSILGRSAVTWRMKGDYANENWAVCP